LLAGTSGDYPPLSLWVGDRVDGFAPTLLEGFCTQKGVELRWIRFRWPELTGDMRVGAFDVVADGITVSPERSVMGRFTVPIARGGAVLLVRRPAWAAQLAAADPLAELRAMDRPELRVVVNRGGHLERVARRLLRAAGVRAIANNGAVREALARGDADAAMTNTFEAPRWRAGLSGIEELGPLSADVTALWLRADRADLAERLDAWLVEQEEKGRLAGLRAQYLGSAAGPATARPLDAILAATAERLALMPLVALAKERIGHAIEDPAQEDRVVAGARAAVAKAAAVRGVVTPATERVDAFFRAQMQAAKTIQKNPREDNEAPALSLETELRPAIARVTAKMAFLVARLPRGLPRAEVTTRTREALTESGLPAADVDAVASALADLVE
jgi:cyclohexadienyl dehydratase